MTSNTFSLTLKPSKYVYKFLWLTGNCISGSSKKIHLYRIYTHNSFWKITLNSIQSDIRQHVMQKHFLKKINNMRQLLVNNTIICSKNTCKKDSNFRSYPYKVKTTNNQQKSLMFLEVAFENVFDFPESRLRHVHARPQSFKT